MLLYEGLSRRRAEIGMLWLGQHGVTARTHTACMNVGVAAYSHSGRIPESLRGESLSEGWVQGTNTAPHSRAMCWLQETDTFITRIHLSCGLLELVGCMDLLIRHVLRRWLSLLLLLVVSPCWVGVVLCVVWARVGRREGRGGRKLWQMVLVVGWNVWLAP